MRLIGPGLPSAIARPPVLRRRSAAAPQTPPPPAMSAAPNAGALRRLAQRGRHAGPYQVCVQAKAAGDAESEVVAAEPLCTGGMVEAMSVSRGHSQDHLSQAVHEGRGADLEIG